MKLWGMPDNRRPIIVYPDIFKTFPANRFQDLYPTFHDLCSDASEDDEYDDILAVIPLIRTIGGIVTRCLDNSVTHILCPNLSGHTCIEWTSLTPIAIFHDKHQGRKLHDELLNRGMESNLLLISAEWVHDLWKSDMNKSTA